MRVGAVGNAGPGGGGGRGWCGDGVASGDGSLDDGLGGGGERNRKFDLDELEKYIDNYNDVTPIQYLIAKYMPDQVHTQAAAMASLALLAESLPSLLAQAGMSSTKKKKHR